MQKRSIGRLEVSALGLGCMGMSEFYGPGDDAESIRTLDRAIDLGIDFFDTADMYGRGENEKLVGKALKSKRDKVKIATKFGIVRTDDPNARGISGKPDYVVSCCEASLERLGVDYIDLYYQHRVDPSVPIEETIGAMAGLVKSGKVRYIGLSEANTEQLRRASKIHAITALQSEYSLWTRDIEKNGVLAACRELNIGVVPYSPLGRGFLTGAVKSTDNLSEDDFRRQNPRFQGENLSHNLKLVEVIEAIAKKKKATPAQIALAWVLAQGNDMVPIPGTKKVSRLEENAASTEIQLSKEELEQLGKLEAPKGDRYAPGGMKSVNVNNARS